MNTCYANLPTGAGVGRTGIWCQNFGKSVFTRGFWIQTRGFIKINLQANRRGINQTFCNFLLRLLALKSIKGLTTKLKSSRRPILLFIWCLLIFRLFNGQLMKFAAESILLTSPKVYWTEACQTSYIECKPKKFFLFVSFLNREKLFKSVWKVDEILFWL